MSNKNEFPVDDREWETQERGMRAAREHGTGAMDPVAENYRRVAIALIRTRREPPADFASDVVERIAVRNAGIERTLFRGLFLVLAAASAIVTARYGGEWWHAMERIMTDETLGWVLAGTACVALSWTASQLRQLARHIGS